MVFDNTNILNIKGYNSSGKSTMLKAIAVALTNMFPKAQTKLIRHGEEYFRIVVHFNDGVSIVRDKYSNGQSLYEMYKEGVCIFTTKEGKRLGRVDDVPEVIKQYLGLCHTSYGVLNYQSRQDKLWLVETTGSENYASLNEILKSEQISRANAAINSDKNALSSEIVSLEAQLQEVTAQYNTSAVYTDELLEALEQRDAYCKGLQKRLSAVKSLLTLHRSIDEIKIIPELQKLDTSRLEASSALSRLATSISSIQVPPTMATIDYGRIEAVGRVLGIARELAEINSFSAEIPQVSLERFESARKLASLADAFVEASSRYAGIVRDTNSLKNRLDAIIRDAEGQGIRFVKCDSCGSYTKVEV
jgi:DNA repair exonuclease SbcCD ATPase subunit